MSSVQYQPFNVWDKTQGVYPPIARATVDLPKNSDRYHLMTNEEQGAQSIPFWHENTCHPETVITIDGDYFITVGKERVHQQKGDVLVIPTGVKHGDVYTPSGYRNIQIENTHPNCTNVPTASKI